MFDRVTLLLARSVRCVCRRGVVIRVVDNVPAVLVMADVAAGSVPDNHAPGLGLLVPAERPRAGAVGLDAVERIDGAVVPFDTPRDVLAVGAALDEGMSGNAFKDPVDIPDPKRGTAFAVYSEDDHSFMFYKRRGVPKVGDMFNDLWHPARLGEFALAILPLQSPGGTHDESLRQFRHPCQQG